MVLFLNFATKESMTCQNLELFSDPLPSLEESRLKLCTLHLVQGLQVYSLQILG